MARNPALITVFTPTYNRAYTLPRLADSLRQQGFRDFEWLVVDDGSTDKTASLLDELQVRGDLPLIVIRKDNGGKHRAINTGAEAAEGTWFFIVDSDDWLPPGALEEVARLTAGASMSPSCCGIIGLRQTPRGEVIGSELPESGGFYNTLRLHYQFGVYGDKAEVFKTEVLRKYPFPGFEGEKFLTEALVWNRMARDGLELLTINKAIYTCEYLEDGLTAASVRLRRHNPAGTLLYYSELMADELPFLKRLRPSTNYVRFAIHSREGLAKGLRNLGDKQAFAWLCLLPGAMFALLDKLKEWRNP